jgi:hypothetical protein
VLQWCRDRLASLSPRTVLLLGYVLFLLWSFPGYMSTDSEVQLAEARSGVFSNAHPPFMAAEWRLLDAIVSGPVLMLLLQGALFLGGLYAILRTVTSPRAAAWIAIGILMFPPVLTVFAVVWKDSQMAAYAVAGIGALLSPRLRIRVIGLVLLVVAASLRHNAAAGIVPIVFFLFEWRGGMGWWKRIAVAVVAIALVVGAMSGLSRLLTSHAVKLSPAFQDVVGIIAWMDDTSDAELRERLKGVPLKTESGIQARARRLYELGGAYRFTQGDDALMHYPRDAAEWAALQRAWIDLVTEQPREYFAMHWDGFEKLIGLTQLPRSPVYNLFIENGTGTIEGIRHNAYPSLGQVYAGRVLYRVSDHTPLYRGWIYIVIGLAMLILFVRDRLTAALVTSGILYELSYFPFSADPDSRYSHWLITSVVIATVIVFIKRRKRFPPPVAPTPMRWRFALTPLRILGIGWLVYLVLYAYPGYMTVEAANLLLDARTGMFTDWHSPVLAQTFRVITFFVGGPPGLLFVQSGLLLFGTFGLLRRIVRDRAAAIGSLCVLMFPPVLAGTAVISRDGMLVAFLVAACAAFTSSRRRMRIAGLVAAMIACGSREGAALAALPIVVGGFVWRADQRWLARVGIAVAAWVACVLLAMGLDAVLPETQTRSREADLALVDIVAVVVHAGPLDDARIRELTPGVNWYGNDLQPRARLVYGKPAQYGYGDRRVFDAWETSDDVDALADGRSRMIREYPGAYVRARAEAMRRHLRAHKRPVFARDVEAASHRETIGHASRPSVIQKGVIWFVKLLGKSPLFTPWLYLALAAVLLPLALVWRQRQAALLLASALAMWVALAYVSWDDTYRHVQWPIVATVLAAALLIAQRSASASRGSSA